MISRRTATALGRAFQNRFTSTRDRTVNRSSLYEFLFNNDYPAWFCNLAKRAQSSEHLKEFFMKLHTGETQYPVTQNWDSKQREQLGQEYLKDLIEDILNSMTEPTQYALERPKLHRLGEELLQSVQLDGYVYENRRLLASEADVLDVSEVSGVLEQLYSSLGLNNRDVALHCLKLSEDHWLNGNWDDCISNARRCLESVLQEVATSHSERTTGSPLQQKKYDKPVEVRDYLEDKGILEVKEKKALAELYGLLSNVGSHPYIAKKDQARLLRQVALLFSQFVMLRYQGFMGTQSY